MRVKFFFKKDCPKCFIAKEVLKNLSSVESYDLDTFDGIAEGAFYQIFSTPSVLIVDEEGREIKSWRGEVPSPRELENLI